MKDEDNSDAGKDFFIDDEDFDLESESEGDKPEWLKRILQSGPLNQTDCGGNCDCSKSISASDLPETDDKPRIDHLQRHLKSVIIGEYLQDPEGDHRVIQGMINLMGSLKTYTDTCIVSVSRTEAKRPVSSKEKECKPWKGWEGLTPTQTFRAALEKTSQNTGRLSTVRVKLM